MDFGRWGVLKVMAEANTDTRPIPGFVPRRGAGFKFLGTSVNYPPAAKVLADVGGYGVVKRGRV